jgi:hypothetical protein
MAANDKNSNAFVGSGMAGECDPEMPVTPELLPLNENVWPKLARQVLKSSWV